MLNIIYVQEVQIYSFIHLSYLENQRNLKKCNETDFFLKTDQTPAEGKGLL